MFWRLLLFGTTAVSVLSSEVYYISEGSKLSLPCMSNNCTWTPDYPLNKNAQNWNCSLDIRQFDPELHSGLWNCSGKSVRLRSLIHSNVSIFGSGDMFIDASRDFTCMARGGEPRPAVLQWVLISKEGYERVIKEETSNQSPIISTQVQLHGEESLHGSRIACRSLQIAHGRKLVLTTDQRVISIEKGMAQSRSSSFQIRSRYPSGLRGKTISVILAKGKMSTFSCSSTEAWHVCQWKSPISKEPCGIFNTDEPRDCRKPWNIRESNELNSTYNSWIVSTRASDRNSCGISGLVTEEHEGIWNCEMQSKPYGKNDQYFHDQQYFEIKTIKPPEVTVSNMPQNIRLSETEAVDIQVDVSNAFPLPILRWTLNSEPFEPLVVSSRETDSSLRAEYQYVAESKHAGKRLSLEVVQKDDEGKEVTSRYESFLAIKALPNNDSLVMGGGIIAAIVIGVISSLLLCCILLLLLIFRRKKRKEVVVVKRAESGVMSTQTLGQTTESTGTMMVNFDNNLERRGSKERLLKEPNYAELEFQRRENVEANRLSLLLLSPDELEAYDYEGSGSRAESLSSLESIDDEPFSLNKSGFAKNPKFKALVDIYPSSDEDSDSITISYEDSEV